MNGTHRITWTLTLLLCLVAGCETVTTEDRSYGMPEGELSSYLDTELERLETLAEEYPKRADYHYRIAGIHFHKARYKDSLGSLEKAIYLDPQQARYHYHLGRIHLMMRDLDQAEAAFRRAVEQTRSDRYSGPRAGLAYVLALKGDHRGAIEEFQTCTRIDPANAEYYYFLGALYDMRKDEENAIRNFREYLERGGTRYRTKAVFILEKLGVTVTETTRVESDDEAPAESTGGFPFGLGLEEDIDPGTD
ncbi:MAG: tetratricopeptide repeat protein [Planctomycetes bacterium]|nr:tetratricopeptide repeat protein [Planctomycetota bacterium]